MQCGLLLHAAVLQYILLRGLWLEHHIEGERFEVSLSLVHLPAAVLSMQ